MIEDFYPTPATLIQKMLSKVNLSKVKSFLEPSAGKGNILDFVFTTEFEYESHHRGVEYKHTKKYEQHHFDFDAIEINPDLQLILQGKKYRVIHDDFLTFRANKQYDLILANFPFSDGEKHLRKALELIEENGGQLVCLVNAETVRNAQTLFRSGVVETLEKLNAEIEYLPNEFLQAERKTGVEVALISVCAERRTRDSIILNELTKSEKVETEEYRETALMPNDFLGSIIAGFNREARLGALLFDEYYALQSTLKDRFDKPGETESYGSPIIEMRVGNDSAGKSRSKGEMINFYLQKVRSKYWSALTSDARFNGKYTSNVQVVLSKKLSDLKDYDFTRFNIEQLEKELMSKITNGIESAILELFDTLSSKHAWYKECDNNVHYYNGWATNKAHKINSKVILPVNGYSSYYGGKYGGNAKLDDHRLNQRFADMIKVFNYLSAGDTVSPQIAGHEFNRANESCSFSNIDLRYFDVTFYKKGTCHIRFKNQRLLDKLNIFGSQRKNWLPPNYGKVRYEDLGVFEQEIVNDFQGKAAYDEVAKNPGNYIVEPKQLMIGTSFTGETI